MGLSNRSSDQKSGSLLVELLICIGLFAVISPALIAGLIITTQGEPQQQARLKATEVLKEAEEAVRIVREKAWDSISADGIYHPQVTGSTYTLAGGTDTVGDFTRQITISDVYRDALGNIATVGTTIFDPSTKKVSITVSWTLPQNSSTGTTLYLTRYLDNLTYTETTTTDFLAGIRLGTTVVATGGGAVTIGYNNKAKWCSPALSSATIDLPDGPPVAVAATASAIATTTPNDVFVAVAPTDSTSIKMAYLTVTANTDPPVPSLIGTFTLDPAKYSSSGLYPVGIGVSNSFKTNDIKYYTSSGGNLYALIATDLPNKEVIAVQIRSGGVNSFQDPVNKIYKYWTFFNTRQYQGDARSTPNQDQAPFGYGAVALSVTGSRGYIASGGYMYVFDLSNIDSKNAANGLDMVGCRLELHGYDCLPNSGLDEKYTSNETGTTFSDTVSPAHNSCSDGGNIELYADHQFSVINVGASTYAFVAVGAGIDPELDVLNLTNVPTSSSSPKINNTSCGRVSGGNAGWHVVGSLDFDPYSGTEEAANSVFVRSDGNRVYMSSNGGILHNGIPDSDQFYIIDTTTKSSPKFLSTWPSNQITPVPGHYANTAESGYYNGNATNIELYPRRALTVLNGARAILVGQDGVGDSIEPQEYQVLNLDNESTPTYCGGINFLPGFNDLTSVSEADGDNFVYMVANTMEHQLKIIQGGPDTGIYMDSGTFESKSFGTSLPATFNHFATTVGMPANTTLKMQVAVVNSGATACSAATYNYVGPGGDPGLYFIPSGTAVSATIPFGTYGGYQNPGKCIRYKLFFNTTDYSQSPVFYDYQINYSP
jgi:hypothetical protein